MQLLRQYAMSFLGIPYKWGGDDTIDGYDCSGLVQDILASAGEDPPGDQSAQTLYDWFSESGRSQHGIRTLGSLAFYGRDAGKIIHVGFCVDSYRMVEAGGGGSTTRTTQDAADQNAFVKLSLINRRQDLVAVMKPRYNKIGMI